MATYSTQIEPARGRTRCSSTWPPSPTPASGIPVSAEGEALTPGSRRSRLGIPARRADRRPGRAVRLPGGRHRPPPPGGPPGTTRAHRLDGHHHGGTGRLLAPGSATWRCSRRAGCCAWPRPSSARSFAAMAERAAAGAPRRVGMTRSRRPPPWTTGPRGDRRRQLQPGRLRACGPDSEHWGPPPDLSGRVVVVTGASSGIGRAAALELARLGATLWLVGRDEERAPRRRPARPAISEPAPQSNRSSSTSSMPTPCVAFAEPRRQRQHERLHALVHAAGALFPTYRSAPAGGELTVATAVLAPFRLTWLLSPLLRRAGGRQHRDGVVGWHVHPALRP